MRLLISFVALLIIISITSFAQPEKKRKYTLEQACSERAQLHTIAFNGLAFMTGNFGADCFFPPGKLTDFFGFQYMRDNDKDEMGHNTDFLTNIANNVYRMLNEEQRKKLLTLAISQEKKYDAFAYKRILLIRAFRQQLENKLPSVSLHLDRNTIINFCGDLYRIDGELSYERAMVLADIINSLSTEQKQQFDLLLFDHSDSWKPMPEQIDKKSMSHRAHVCMMTYASELFSWYKGSLMADIYFCPERHGTYFGGFYMKDYPAMNNHGYNISTSLTGDAGKAFLDLLNADQRKQIEELPVLQSSYLKNLVDLRTHICQELRSMMNGVKPNREKLINQVVEYGKLDGAMSYLYTMAFTKVFTTLTESQKASMKKLRNQEILPSGLYLFSDPISLDDLNRFTQSEKSTDNFFSY